MADLISLDVTTLQQRSPVRKAPHEERRECRDCGAHARVLIAYGVRTGHCSVCGSDRLEPITAASGITVRGRFSRTR